MADTARTEKYVLDYAYKRSTGPIIGRFLGGLREKRILGAKTRSGKVLVPPTEYDPETAEPVSDLVEVGAIGVVTTWAWVQEPRSGQPLAHPFGWALIKLDGADTALLHAVDAGSEERMRTGMRVQARWRADRIGEIRDIAYFEPEGWQEDERAGSDQGARSERHAPRTAGEGELEPRADVAPEARDGHHPALLIETLGAVTRFVSPIRFEYEVSPGRAQARFLDGLIEGRVVGRRCPNCQKVYVPPPGCCPTCAVPFDAEVELRDEGTVTTFCIVCIPHDALRLELPYVAAWILLDGADIPIFHLVGGIAANEVRMGLRVKAIWAPPKDRKPSLEAILHFAPSGAEDAPFASYRDHL